MSTESTLDSMVKVAPAASVGGLALLSVPLSDWLVICTLIYTVLIILDKVFPGIVSRAGKMLISLFTWGSRG